jgi:hypothetical protein
MNDYVKQKKYFVDTCLKPDYWSRQNEHLKSLLQTEASSSQKEIQGFVSRLQSLFPKWIVWEAFRSGSVYYALITNDCHWKIVYGNEYTRFLEGSVDASNCITFICLQSVAHDFHIIIGDSKGSVSYVVYNVTHENLNKIRSLFYANDSLLPSVSTSGRNNVKFLSSIISKELFSLSYFWVVYESCILLLAIDHDIENVQVTKLKVIIQYNVPFNAKLINCEVGSLVFLFFVL